MTQKLTNFPCIVTMIHSKFFNVFILVHQKSFGAAKKTFVLLFFLHFSKICISNTILSFIVRVFTSALRGTIRVARICRREGFPTSLTSFILEISIWILSDSHTSSFLISIQHLQDSETLRSRQLL